MRQNVARRREPGGCARLNNPRAALSPSVEKKVQPAAPRRKGRHDREEKERHPRSRRRRVARHRTGGETADPHRGFTRASRGPGEGRSRTAQATTRVSAPALCRRSTRHSTPACPSSVSGAGGQGAARIRAWAGSAMAGAGAAALGTRAATSGAGRQVGDGWRKGTQRRAGSCARGTAQGGVRGRRPRRPPGIMVQGIARPTEPGRDRRRDVER